MYPLNYFINISEIPVASVSVGRHILNSESAVRITPKFLHNIITHLVHNALIKRLPLDKWQNNKSNLNSQINWDYGLARVYYMRITKFIKRMSRSGNLQGHRL